MEEKEFTGKNVEEAIEKGLKELGVLREDVEVRILDEGKPGLFGLMGASPAKVKLILKKERGFRKQGEGTGIDLASISTALKAEVEKILKLMGLGGEVFPSIQEERLVADIKTENGAILIGKRGQTLDALQYIVNLLVSKSEKTHVRVTLDVENYRKRREKALEKMARQIAEEVKSKGEKRELEPMTPYERRVIHLALKDDKDIETTSVGEGNRRRVVISPRKKEVGS